MSRTLGGLDKFLAHAVFERYRELYNSDLADLLGNRLEPDLAAAIVLWAHSQDPTGYCFHYPGIPAGVVVSAIDNIKVKLYIMLYVITVYIVGSVIDGLSCYRFIRRTWLKSTRRC